VEDVEIIIPFSRSVRTANFKVTVGSVLFDEANKIARWEVGKLQGDRFPQLTGTILYQPNSKGKDEAPAIQMNWKVASASVSGLAVASLQLTNESYKPYKGVRTVARSGKFQIRSV
jgi:AP-3 complex subunit mu